MNAWDSFLKTKQITMNQQWINFKFLQASFWNCCAIIRGTDIPSHEMKDVIYFNNFPVIFEFDS